MSSARGSKEIEQPALRSLHEYAWPGNIRQLQSVVERALILSETEQICLKDIKSELRTAYSSQAADFELSDDGINFEEFERELLKKAMAKSNNVVAKAAKLLGMSYKTFWYRWEKMSMDSPSGRKQPSDEP